MRSPSQHLLVLLLGPILALTLLSVPAGVASATTQTAVSAVASVRISAAVGVSGGSALISGTGFSSGERVDLYVGVRSVGAVTASVDGSFTGIRITVPAATPPGSIPVLANGRYSRFTAQASYLVQTGWSQSGYDAAHADLDPYEQVINPTNVADLIPDRVTGSDEGPGRPAVSDGAVYLATGDGGGTSAVTLDSGVYRWTHPDPQATNAGTVATGARIFYRSGSEIQALDARTGARIWRSSFSANGAAVSGFSYADGGLYVVAGGSGTQSLFRLSATTGSLEWESYGPYDVQQPAALGGVVYLRQAGGGILALEASTRAVLWTTLVPSTDPGLLTVSGDSVVSPFRYGLAVLDRATGTVRWTTSSGVTGDVAVADGRVLCDCFDFGRGRELVTALDLRTGAKLWSTDGPGGTPLVAGGVVYAGSDQNVQALDPTSGKLLTTLALPELDPNSLPYLDAPVSVVDGSVIASVQNFGERFEGAGVYRFVLPDRDVAPAVRTVDDTVTGTGDNQVDYVGGWVAGSRPGAYQDTFHYARSRGALVTLTFSGVGARIWYSAAPGFGRATVSLDGRPPITLDLSSPVKRDGVKSWTSGELAAGSHTLTVRSVDASVVDLDRIELGLF